ncbi:RES domain-containing protein [Pseudomonas sp. MWU12-2323]|uniref:RES family NAD+ phosphorylase n=1 Tax=Pseudomonas gingeri TaxID=117681 RepID=A0A7Y7WLA1_9PSED|nr:RES domain-containing protein [Pseudomonas sp. MWU12-2323]NWB83604.1 RES family NAD+ phosphorylase [Pseudomonas gingeri]
MIETAPHTEQVHSEVHSTRDLVLADLGSVALRKLGVPRRHLIDTEKDQYPATRQWAAAIHTQCPDIQGLSWVSRQADSARAVMLFGDRVPDGALRQQGEPRSLIQDEDAYAEVLALYPWYGRGGAGVGEELCEEAPA